MKSLIWIAIFMVAVFADENENKNDERIRAKLLKSYDKKVRPQQFHNGTTRVYVEMFTRSIDVDDSKEELQVDSWLLLYWMDDRLMWTSKDFGDVSKVFFGDEELWKPDLAVYNNADISEVDHYGNTHFHVYASGSVWWVPPTRTMSHCKIDLTNWPYDTQVCGITMGSWTSLGYEIEFRTYHNITEMHLGYFLNVSSHWQLEKAEQRIDSFSYGEVIYYQEVIFNFTLKRVSPSFAPVVVVPAAMLPLLLLVQFILPVDHPKRITIGCFCSVLVILEMIFIKSTVPRVGTTVPLLVSYYSLAFVIVVLTVALSAILGRISHPQNPLLSFPPGQFVKMILTGPLAKILCLEEHAGKVGLSNRGAEDGEVLDSGSNSPSYAHEWLLVAKSIDRIAFIIFIFIFVISLIVYTS